MKRGISADQEQIPDGTGLKGRRIKRDAKGQNVQDREQTRIGRQGVALFREGWDGNRNLAVK